MNLRDELAKSFHEVQQEAINGLMALFVQTIEVRLHYLHEAFTNNTLNHQEWLARADELERFRLICTKTKEET